MPPRASCGRAFDPQGSRGIGWTQAESTFSQMNFEVQEDVLKYISSHKELIRQPHMCIYSHTHMHIYACIRIYTYTPVHMYTYTRIHIYTYTHVHTYTCAHIHIHIHIHVHMHTYTHTHTITHIHVHGFDGFSITLFLDKHQRRHCFHFGQTVMRRECDVGYFCNLLHTRTLYR